MVTTQHNHQIPPQVLRAYALIADGERGILIGPRDEFVWMCVPLGLRCRIFLADRRPGRIRDHPG